VAVFLTGGTGFIGGHLLRRLLRDGRDVRALVRSEGAAAELLRFGAEPLVGDLRDEGVMRSGMAGSEIVFHVAGLNEPCPRDLVQMYRVNVDGVRSVVRSAAAAGVRRVVMTSSVAAVGEPAGAVAREDTPHSGEFLSHYARSKFLGEVAGFEEGERHGIEVVAVLPSSVQGPGRDTGSAKILRYALSSSRPLLIDATLSIVDIDDCTAGHLLAAERGEAGERYLLSGSSLTTLDVVEVIAEVTDREIHPIRVPRALLRAAMPVAALAGPWVGRGLVCGDMVRTLLHGHRVDGSRAERELGLVYTPFPETVVRTYHWFVEEGLVNQSLRS